MKSTEQSPSWEAKRSSVSQEIRRILWNKKVHCCIRNRQQPVYILSQINLPYASPLHLFKIESISIQFSSKQQLKFIVCSGRWINIPLWYSIQMGMSHIKIL